MSQSTCFQSGRIYGQDISSGAAVAALLTQQYDRHKNKDQASSKKIGRALDMCCCPGLKLCAIADWLESGTVVGVDVSESRLSTCKKIVTKYQTDNDKVKIRIYHGDGRRFGESQRLLFDSDIMRQEKAVLGKRKRMNKSARSRERKQLAQLDTKFTEQLFDWVLVDAECSTDGSLKHLPKIMEKKGLTKLINEKELTDLVDLQKGLARSGFQLLRTGGCMVYSTCSLSEKQNEEVVQWVLDTEPLARIIPLRIEAEISMELVREGSIRGTLRFLPLLGEPQDEYCKNLFGGGFFIAKIVKVDQ